MYIQWFCVNFAIFTLDIFPTLCAMPEKTSLYMTLAQRKFIFFMSPNIFSKSWCSYWPLFWENNRLFTVYWNIIIIIFFLICRKSANSYSYFFLLSFFFFLSGVFFLQSIFWFSTKVLLLIFSDLVQRSYE